MKTIQINHIAKTEGHLSFVGALIDADFAQARIETEEGARLIEGILLGRQYFEAPVITSRICGVCPIVHNLTAIKGLESALNIRPTKEILLLREMMICSQWIHSHALHVFFLSFPDLVGISNNFKLVRKFSAETQLALAVRDFGVRLAGIIGGRTVHPVNSVVGGFNVEPDFRELEEIMAKQPAALAQTINLFERLSRYKFPAFDSPTNYASLKNKNKYAIYDGAAYFSDSKKYFNAETFLRVVEEDTLANEKVKRSQYFGRPFMVGALSRLNNNQALLRTEARKIWNKISDGKIVFNPFLNVWAQAVEIIHCLETVAGLFEEYKRKRKQKNFLNKLKVKFSPNPGTGRAMMEAPRGILFHEYELNKSGQIVHCNIVTPTAMFLANLEKDLESFLPKIKKLNPKEQEQLIKMLIRAYDPCISCATH